MAFTPAMYDQKFINNEITIYTQQALQRIKNQYIHCTKTVTLTDSETEEGQNEWDFFKRCNCAQTIIRCNNIHYSYAKV